MSETDDLVMHLKRCGYVDPTDDTVATYNETGPVFQPAKRLAADILAGGYRPDTEVIVATDTGTCTCGAGVETRHHEPECGLELVDLMGMDRAARQFGYIRVSTDEHTIKRVTEGMHQSLCGCDWTRHPEGSRDIWRRDAHAAIKALLGDQQ